LQARLQLSLVEARAPTTFGLAAPSGNTVRECEPPWTATLDHTSVCGKGQMPHRQGMRVGSAMEIAAEFCAEFEP